MAEQLSLFGDEPKKTHRIVFFDLETLREAQEVGGWGNISKMGMACAVCYDTLEDCYTHYLEKDVQELITKLRQADLVVGYNIRRFDYVVLGAYSDFNFSALPTFDMLEEVTRILGHRLKLDSIALATLGQGKSADGLQCLRWVKEGKMDLIVEYCKKDVEITRDVFWHGVQKKMLMYQNRSERAQMAVAWDLAQIIGS